MGCYRNMFVFTTILLLGLQQIWALRPLKEEPWLQNNLVLQSLQRGPMRASQKNPCLTIPGRSRGRCTLSEMNVAGHITHAPPAFPDIVVKFGAASFDASETQKQGPSS